MSRETLHQAVEQLNNRPALLAGRYVGGLVSLGEVTSGGLIGDLREIAAMSSVQEAERARQASERRSNLLAAYGYQETRQDKPFAFADGRAIIPIHGLLINRCTWSWGFVTGYNFIRAQVHAASADADVTQIIYDVNSNGGTVAGCQETADIIYAASEGQGGKPSLAVVDANCYSAGYYLASQADKVAVTPTGGVGSIGVLVMHLDVSEALSKMGVKITFVTAGKHKVDGNPFEPLPKAVRSDLQSEIDKMYDRFVATVSRSRPGLSEETIRGTEARCYQADDALALGLVDQVATPPEAMEGFFDDDAEDDEEMQQEGTSRMTVKTDTAAAQPNTASAETAAEATAHAEQAATAARTAERERVRGIQTHAEAEGRTELASHLALSTDLSVEAAAGILKASPKAESKQATGTGEPNHFKAAMDSGTQPNVGAGSEASPPEAAGKLTRAQEILGAQATMMGRKPDKAA